MKTLLTSFFILLVACASTKPSPVPNPIPVPTPTPEPIVVDTIHKVVTVTDTVKGRDLSITDFGAVGNGTYDNSVAIQNAIDYVITHPQKLIVPIGEFAYSKSILAQNFEKFFTLHIAGVLPSKSASKQYLSIFTYTGRTGYAFGVQLAKGIIIENIFFQGQYRKPESITNKNIGTLKFSDWVDSTITDSRYNPYAGISIDPNENASGARGGSSDVTIRNCAVKKFMVGIMLTANPSTLNCDMINILNNDVELVRVAIAIGQDQSKEIHIDNIKVWGSTHTVLDGVHYGRGTGGGSVDMQGGNIAGNVNQIVNVSTDRFNFTSYALHAESLFRFGYVGFGAGANLTVPQIDFLTGPGLPAADFLFGGQINIYGGCIRYYDNQPSHRMNLTNFAGALRDMTLNTEPIITGLIGYPGAVYPQPIFENVHRYYGPGNGGQITKKENVYRLGRLYTLTINKTNWTATVTGENYAQSVHVGDYLLGAPCSACKKYYDPETNPQNSTTVQLGRVVSISGDTITLDDVGLNSDTGYDAIYLSIVNENQ